MRKKREKVSFSAAAGGVIEDGERRQQTMKRRNDLCSRYVRLVLFRGNKEKGKRAVGDKEL